MVQQVASNGREKVPNGSASVVTFQVGPTDGFAGAGPADPWVEFYCPLEVVPRGFPVTQLEAGFSYLFTPFGAIRGREQFAMFFEESR